MSRHSTAPPVFSSIRGVLLVLAFGFGQFATAQPNTSEGGDAQLEAVKKVHLEFYAALNAMLQGDAKPFAEVWWHTEDVVYMGADGSYNLGWEQTYANWRKQAALKIGGEVKLSKVNYTIGADLAMANQAVSGTNYFNGEPRKINLRATSVFRKQDGAWKMICHHVDVIPPLDATLKAGE